ncbi:hypothetical protein ACYZX9_14595 [Sphingomonas citri]
MRAGFTFPVAAALSIVASGCSLPFGDRAAEINWRASQAPGTITISDPKLYRREALLNEQQREVAWIDELLDASKTIEFKPELVRETEQITAIAAALGLSWDPAAGLANRRSKETGAIQQDIDVLRMQLQLDQLRRDAEQVRTAMASQTGPVNSGLGTLTPGAAPAASTGPLAASVDELKNAISTLTADMATRLDAEGKPAALANAVSNPADIFRDRVAYRDLLKAARNAASRDELHDMDGATLLRLNFQSTILPDPNRPDAPGVIQMEVRGPDEISQPETVERIYKSWLSYVNDSLNTWTGAQPVVDTSLLRASISRNFDSVEYRYPLSPPQPAPAVDGGKKPIKPKLPPTVVQAPIPAVCAGLVVGPMAATPGCGALKYVVPRFVGTTEAEGAYSRLDRYLQLFGVPIDAEYQLIGDGGADAAQNLAARRQLASPASKLVVKCVVDPTVQGEDFRLRDKLIEAANRLAAGEILIDIDRRARALLSANKVVPPSEPRMEEIERRTQNAQELLETFERFAFKGCSDDERFALRRAHGRIDIPARFSALMRDSARISIYDVGPREQVQQVSTVARVANTLSLAVSLAASDPSSGAAAKAAAGYSKQAVGRAAAIERVPAVVGYSVLEKRKFGWVIGPRMTLDPKGKMVSDQTLRTYDLTVELAVPAWWPYFTLRPLTSWGPDTRTISEGALIAPAETSASRGLGEARGRTTLGEPAQSKSLVAVLPLARVPMSPTVGDMAALTAQLAPGDLSTTRKAWLHDPDLHDQAVFACKPSTLVLDGENVWRSTVAVLGGLKLPATAISVSPAMSGILLDVPALGDTVADVQTFAKMPLVLLTPYGAASGRVDYVRKPDTGCAPAAKTDGPLVTEVLSRDIRVPSDLVFTISGSKLTQVTKVTLNGGPGSINKQTDKSLTVSFKSVDTANIPTSNTVPLSFFSKDETKVAETMVRATAIPNEK